MGVYRKKFDIQDASKKNYVVFEGVSSSIELYVNDQYVGFSTGSHMQAEFDISDFVVKGSNSLVAKVMKWSVGMGGKVNNKVRIYVNGWFAGAKEPEEFGEKAKIAVERGVTAMKWDPFGKNYLNISNQDLDKALRCVAAVRDAVGDKVDLLIEGHGRFNVPTGIKIAKELEQFKPMFFEEPVPPNNIDALKQVRDKSPIAISAGERLYTRYDYRPLFDKMAADYIQPDISHAGGIMELKKIAAEAESRYIPFAPHNPSGPVANAATLQFAATCPNFEILEIMYSDVDWRKDVTNEALDYKDGYITIPDKPGLGIEIDEEMCLEHPYQVHTLRHYTGALTDIRPAKTEFYF